MCILFVKKKTNAHSCKVPLFAITSGVRKEWYRDDLEECAKKDPLPRLQKVTISRSRSWCFEITKIEESVKALVEADYQKALLEEDPQLKICWYTICANTNYTEEKSRVNHQARKKQN